MAKKTQTRHERAPLGEALRREGIPVDAMAKACGCSNKTAWRWAMGQTTPLPPYRPKLRAFLGKRLPRFDADGLFA